MAGLTLKVHCKSLTPMLAAGAEPTTRFELRAPSVKGALRFWWRAFHAYDSEADLFEEESKLFGGQRRNTSGSDKWEPQAGAFRMDVFHAEPPQKFNPGRGGPPDKLNLGDDVSSEWGDGVCYCFFPILSAKTIQKKNHYWIHNIKKGGKPVVQPGFSFELRFFVPDGNQEVLAEVLRALWLLMNFGGLGGRSRRGAGSFTIEEFDPTLETFKLNDLPPFNHDSFKTPRAYLAAGLKIILDKWGFIRKPYSLPDYTGFRLGHSEIRIFRDPKIGKGSGALKVMDAIGRKMKAFRDTNPHDEAEQMHHALTGEAGYKVPSFAVLQKAQLGLPIIYNFRGRGRFAGGGPPDRNLNYEAKGVTYNEEPDKNKDAQRRASPLLISCHEFKDTPYAVICHFPAPILPKGQRIWLKSKPGGHDHYPQAPTGYDYVDKLVILGDPVNHRQSLSSAFRYHEVLFKRPPTKTPKPPDVPPADPEEQKKRYLETAPTREDQLPWFLGEISGAATGSGKKRRWPCHLWFQEGDSLQKDPETWYLREKNLPVATKQRLQPGTLFLCTKQADRSTPPTNNYLYNITEP